MLCHFAFSLLYICMFAILSDLPFFWEGCLRSPFFGGGRSRSPFAEFLELTLWSEIISSNTRHTPYYSCCCILSKWLRHFLLDVCYRNSFMVWSSFRSTIHVVLLGLSLSTTVYWALYKFQKLKKQQQQKLKKWHTQI